MSTRFFDHARGAYFYNGKKQWQQEHQGHLEYESNRPPEGASHYFKIFRMGMDICAQCQKPRSEHPRAPR